MSEVASESTIFAALATSAIAKIIFGALTRRNRKRSMVPVGRVTQLTCYPVKSCRGITVDGAVCTDLGLRVGKVTDRNWLVARSNGDFVTQRQSSKMALIQVAINEKDLVFNAPQMPTLTVPIDMVPDRSKVVRCRVWDARMEGMDCGDDAAFWLSTYLQIPGLRLLYSAPGLQRRDLTKTEKPWGNPALPGDQAAYSDFCGYLVATEESLAFVNDYLTTPVPMKRFRPSIVVAGSPAFDEHTPSRLVKHTAVNQNVWTVKMKLRGVGATRDNWQEIQIGESATLRMLDPCTRCVLTTVDEDTGERDPNGEPLATLKNIRCFPEYGTAPLFAVNATLDTPGVIKVGDPVFAIRKKK